MSTAPGTPLRVLHCFDTYLPDTRLWLFTLLRALRRTRVLITAHEYELGRFLDPGFDLVRRPFRHPQVPDREPIRLTTRVALSAYSRLVRLLLHFRARAGDVRIVHSHFGNVGCWYSKLASGLRTPHVVSFYGYDYGLLSADAVWRSRFEVLFQQAAAFVCEGRHGAQSLRRGGCPEEKIHCIPLGIERRSERTRRHVKRRRRLRLLQIARFNEKKGHVFTVRAFLRALSDRPDMTLTLVGATPGAVLDSILGLLSERRNADRVRILPPVRPEELPGLMESHEVFIQPSVHARNGDCEGGAPTVLLEAQAAGLPVIGTAHCDIPSVVLHDTTGLLVGEREVEALARAIDQFYDMDPETYTTFSRAGQRHVASGFDVASSAGALENLYRQLHDASHASAHPS